MKEGDIIQDGPWEGFEVISIYTRAQAIEDGVLVDVSNIAEESGFRYPVAVTRAVWDEYITPDPRSKQWGQSEEGRLWDMLWMAFLAIKRANNTSLAPVDQLKFSVIMIMKEKQRKIIVLKMVVGPGDNLEPVITIMRPDED